MIYESQMNNAELAEAISAAYQRAGEASEVQRMHKEQMKALMRVQLIRASFISIKDQSNENS